MAEIVFRHPMNEVLLNIARVEHCRELYLGYLVPTLIDQAIASPGDDADDELMRELYEWYSGWATGEVLVVGYLSLFHLWERQIQGLFARQFRRLNERVPKRAPGESVVYFAQRILEARFRVEPPQEYWELIDTGRLVSNAVKHGGDAINRLDQRFVARSTDDLGEPTVVVSSKCFEELCDGLISFWQGLPHTIEDD